MIVNFLTKKTVSRDKLPVIYQWFINITLPQFTEIWVGWIGWAELICDTVWNGWSSSWSTWLIWSCVADLHKESWLIWVIPEKSAELADQPSVGGSHWFITVFWHKGDQPGFSCRSATRRITPVYPLRSVNNWLIDLEQSTDLADQSIVMAYQTRSNAPLGKLTPGQIPPVVCLPVKGPQLKCHMRSQAP